MTNHLPEHNYLIGEQNAELQAALLEDKVPPTWSDEDLSLLYDSEDLGYMQEHEGEFISETGSDIFLGYGPEPRNASYALSEARNLYNDHFRRTHLGLSKESIEKKYCNLYGAPLRSRAAGAR